eukprot:2570039-Amphidinium_carterae.1
MHELHPTETLCTSCRTPYGSTQRFAKGQSLRVFGLGNNRHYIPRWMSSVREVHYFKQYLPSRTR